MSDKKRCDWVPLNDPIYMKYHDEEWGVPIHDDIRLFELLMLEGAQAGLSWKTILNRRENYRKAFDGFDPGAISKYDQDKIESLLADSGIIRNKLKIQSVIQNAKSFLAVKDEFGTFDSYIWQFTGNKPKVNGWQSIKQVPAKTAESDAMSKDLSKRGFKFVGSTICYAFMQATGIVNDHTVDCFRYGEIIDQFHL